MIHGLPYGMGAIGPAHRLVDWTDGCIAVTNEEMDEGWFDADAATFGDRVTGAREAAGMTQKQLAKRLGARKVMALINRASYVELVQSGPIDIAISPQQATIGTLLTHVRRGDVVMVHALRRGAAEAIEAVAHGDFKSSKVVGRRIEEIRLPEGTNISAIVRGEDVIIAHHDTVIESEDHVIMFLVDKKRIADVERLFQVGVIFL